jgi:hypothetical protein
MPGNRLRPLPAEEEGYSTTTTMTKMTTRKTPETKRLGESRLLMMRRRCAIKVIPLPMCMYCYLVAGK